MDDYAICDISREDVIEEVWEKGLVVEGYNPDLYRKDFAGAWMSRSAYGDKDSLLGWEIDHVYPVSLGGQNHFVNLRPMNIRNNRSKGNSYPRYAYALKADGNQNVESDGFCVVRDTLQDILKEIYKIDE